MVIISTRAVATIIQAVSAALMLEVSANAGVANAMIAAEAAGAANVALPHECAPMVFSPGFRSLLFDQTNPRVPDAVRHSSCRSAEPGSYQTLEFVTAPALQRTATQVLRAALRPGHKVIITAR